MCCSFRIRFIIIWRWIWPCWMPWPNVTKKKLQYIVPWPNVTKRDQNVSVTKNGKTWPIVTKIQFWSLGSYIKREWPKASKRDQKWGHRPWPNVTKRDQTWPKLIRDQTWLNVTKNKSIYKAQTLKMRWQILVTLWSLKRFWSLARYHWDL